MFNLDILFSMSNIILFMAIFTRLSGLFTSAPLFSTYPIPAQVKIWLSAAIAFILFPIVQVNTQFAVPNSVPALTLILFKEFAIGYAIGFCANILFIGIELGVNTFTIQMGLSADQALNPTSGGNSPVITQAFTYLASMLFIGLGAHQWLFSAIYNSFKSMPVGYIVGFSPSLVEQIVIITGQIFSVGLGIALPIFGILFIYHGLSNMRQALELRQYKDKGWWVPVLIAATTILLGIFIINHPFGTMDVVMRIIGACLLYDGLTNTMLVGRFVRSIRNFRKLEEAESAVNMEDVITDESEVIEGEYKEL